MKINKISDDIHIDAFEKNKICEWHIKHKIMDALNNENVFKKVRDIQLTNMGFLNIFRPNFFIDFIKTKIEEYQN